MFRKKQREDTTLSLIKGLLLGLTVSAPIAAWLSPRSGKETRRRIFRGGEAIVQKTGDAFGQIGSGVKQLPDQIQQKVGQIRGESVEDALEEGKAIAAQRRLTQ